MQLLTFSKSLTVIGQGYFIVMKSRVYPEQTTTSNMCLVSCATINVASQVAGCPSLVSFTRSVRLIAVVQLGFTVEEFARFHRKTGRMCVLNCSNIILSDCSSVAFDVTRTDIWLNWKLNISMLYHPSFICILLETLIPFCSTTQNHHNLSAKCDRTAPCRCFVLLNGPPVLLTSKGTGRSKYQSTGGTITDCSDDVGNYCQPESGSFHLR